MPAVNRAGKTRIVQKDMPCAACVAEMPSSPISVAVSKPSAEQEADRIHVPGTRNDLEHRAEDAGEKPAPGQKRIEVLVDDPLAATRPHKS